MTRVLASNQTESATLPVFAEELPALQHACSAHPEQFELAARRVRASVSRSAGLSEVWFDEERVIRNARVSDVECTEWICTPLGVERTLTGEHGVITERIVLAPDAPAMLIEWSSPTAFAFEISWHYEEGDPSAVMFSAAVDVMTSESSDGGVMHARVAMTAGSSVRMLVTTEMPDLADMHPAAWIRLHATAAQRRRLEIIRLDCPDPATNDAWQWAMYHLVAAGDVAVPDATELPASISAEPWPPHTSAHDRASARELVSGFFKNVLQVAPDVARERLSIRIQLPESWSEASIHNIRLGDALVDLHVERLEGSVKVRAVQSSGAYPIRLILETVLPFAPRYASVDGEYADLNVRPADSRFIAPVQIMLDHERVLEFRPA